MGRLKAGLITVCIATALLLAGAPGAAGTPQSRLARAVYITTSKGCDCTLKRCQAGEAVVARVFSGARQRLLSRLDMAKDKDAAASCIQKYRVVVLPSLLLLDGQGRLLWSAQGEMVGEEIVKQLGRFGG